MLLSDSALVELALVDFQATAIKRNSVTTLILTSSWFSAKWAEDARLWDKMSDSERAAFPLILCVPITYYVIKYLETLGIG